MGTWGVALFSDDLAADLREEFRDLIGDGLSASAAVDKLLEEYSTALNDDEMRVFWLALAAVAWNLGRLEERTKREALRVIDSGQDLERWDIRRDRKQRAKVLERLRAQLLSLPPAPKRVPRTVKSTNDWAIGEVVGLRLASRRWALMRVIGHHTDKGGRFAICELLDWTGESLPQADEIERLSVRREAAPRGTSQFLFEEPRKKKDQTRVQRLGVLSTPAQTCGGYTGLVWPYVDRLMKELFGME